MYAFLVLLLNQFLAAAGLVTRVPNDGEAEALVPSDIDFDHAYTNDRTTFNSQFLIYHAEVQDRWQQAVAFGLVDLMEKDLVADESVARSVMASSTVKPLYGLNDVIHKNRGARSEAGFRKHTHRISLRDVGDAVDLMSLSGTDALDLMTDMNLSLTLLQQLRELDNILLRWISAKNAATAAGIPLAEVLALYRAEGNLGIPMPTSRAAGALPALENWSESSRLNGSNGPIPNISKLIYMADVSAITASDRLKFVQEVSVLLWLVQLAGLDIVINEWNNNGGRPIDTLAQWSKEHWDHKGPTVTLASRKQFWQEIIDDMSVRWVERNPAGQLVFHDYPDDGSLPASSNARFVQVTPNHPEKLIAAALQEAALFIRFVGAADSFLFGRGIYGLDPAHSPPKWIMPVRMTYAVYNLFVSGSQGSPPMGFIASAISHAHRSQKAIHKPLRDEINGDTAFKAIVKDLNRKISGIDKHPVTKKAYTPSEIEGAFGIDIIDWLADPNKGKQRIELIAYFIATADTRVWRSWNKPSLSPRGNANRYHIHLDYYRRVTGETLEF
ncbi:MAG: hypothetical protein ACE5F3_08595 [Mariprofundaceae bacterium]